MTEGNIIFFGGWVKMNEPEKNTYLEMLLLQNQLIIQQNQFIIKTLRMEFNTTLFKDEANELRYRADEMIKLIDSLLQTDPQQRER